MGSAAVCANGRDACHYTLSADRSNRKHKSPPFASQQPFLLPSTTTTPARAIDKATQTPPRHRTGKLFMSLSSSDNTTEDQSSSPSTPTPPEYQRLDYATLLGHPHDTVDPQATEPFWHQYPDPTRNYYYKTNTFYTTTPLYYIDQGGMSSEQRVLVGYGLRKNGRQSRPRETVMVWQGTNEVSGLKSLVGEISLAVLTRFSKHAKQEFPKELATTASIPSNAIVEKGTKKPAIDWADDDNDEPFVIAPEKAASTEDAAEVTVERPSTGETALATSFPSLPKCRNFVVGTYAFTQPKLSHLKYILQWMEANKNSHHGEPLLPITPDPLDTIDARTLLDTYIAVLAFDLAPFPHPLRHEILTRLTHEPTQLKQLQYMYDRLPEGDPIINRLVTSICEHEEAGHYSPMEYHEIWNWVENWVEDGGVDDGGKLAEHFARVERSRKRKAKEAQRGEKREQAFGKLRSGFEALAGPLGNALPVVEGKDGRRRPRRQQQANGKAAAATADVKGAAYGKDTAGKPTAGASK